LYGAPPHAPFDYVISKWKLDYSMGLDYVISKVRNFIMLADTKKGKVKLPFFYDFQAVD
jgi:hypothetical protein